MELKRKLLDVLLSDARETTEGIARQLGTDVGTVEALIEELESDGAIRGYQAVIDWDNVDEPHARGEVELNVELDRETSYEDIATRIAKFPEVSSLRLVSGGYDFALDVESDSMRNISRFVSEQIAPIPEVTQTVTHFSMTTYKERGVYFGDGDEDERLAVSP